MLQWVQRESFLCKQSCYKTGLQYQWGFFLFLLQELNERWRSLQQLAEERSQLLGSAHEVQRFHRWGVCIIFGLNSVKSFVCLRVLKHSGTYSKQIIFQLPACSMEVTPPVVQQEFFIFFLERCVNTKAWNCCGLGRSGLLSYFANVHLCHLGK